LPCWPRSGRNSRRTRRKPCGASIRGADLQRLIAPRKTRTIRTGHAPKTDTAYRGGKQAADIAYLGRLPQAAPKRGKCSSGSPFKIGAKNGDGSRSARPRLAHAFEIGTRENLRRMPRYGAYTYVLFRPATRPAAIP